MQPAFILTPKVQPSRESGSSGESVGGDRAFKHPFWEDAIIFTHVFEVPQHKAIKKVTIG